MRARRSFRQFRARSSWASEAGGPRPHFASTRFDDWRTCASTALCWRTSRTGRRTTTQVPLVDRLRPEDSYDLAIVIVRRNQIPSLLPVLAGNHRIPSVLFLSNNAAGEQDMIEALGRECVLIGMPNAGGAREGHVVRYLWSRWISLVFGESIPRF
jgi:hypothetical protein